MYIYMYINLVLISSYLLLFLSLDVLIKLVIIINKTYKKERDFNPQHFNKNNAQNKYNAKDIRLMQQKTND